MRNRGLVTIAALPGCSLLTAAPSTVWSPSSTARPRGETTIDPSCRRDLSPSFDDLNPTRAKEAVRQERRRQAVPLFLTSYAGDERVG